MSRSERWRADGLIISVQRNSNIATYLVYEQIKENYVTQELANYHLLLARFFTFTSEETYGVLQVLLVNKNVFLLCLKIVRNQAQQIFPGLWNLLTEFQTLSPDFDSQSFSTPDSFTPKNPLLTTHSFTATFKFFSDSQLY